MLRFVEVCPRCGEPVAAEARFCPACGAGLRPAAATRSAVNTGEAVVSIGPGHESGEALALGDVVNTASRLQTAAPPGRLGTPSGRWEALAAWHRRSTQPATTTPRRARTFDLRR